MTPADWTVVRFTQEARARQRWLLVAVALASLVLGYFAGREHFRYELNASFDHAAEDFRRSLDRSTGPPPH